MQYCVESNQSVAHRGDRLAASTSGNLFAVNILAALKYIIN